MVTCCEMFSDDVLPLPPSHAFHDPVRAGRPVLLVIGPDVPAQPTAPDSKPGLASRLPPAGGVVGGVVVPKSLSA